MKGRKRSLKLKEAKTDETQQLTWFVVCRALNIEFPLVNNMGSSLTKREAWKSSRSDTGNLTSLIYA